MVFKVVGVGVVGLLCSIVIKQYKPEVAIIINIATGILIFTMLISSISDLIKNFLNITTESNLPTNLISVMLKVIGIGYLIEFSADIAEDAGNTSIANKIIFGGKVIIACLAIPLIVDMFKLLINML